MFLIEADLMSASFFIMHVIYVHKSINPVNIEIQFSK